MSIVLASVQGGAGAALLAAQHDESAATGILVCCQEALEKVHRATFAAMQHAAAAVPNGASPPAWDAASVMAAQRCRVLDGVTILFAKCTLSLKVRMRQCEHGRCFVAEPHTSRPMQSACQFTKRLVLISALQHAPARSVAIHIMQENKVGQLRDIAQQCGARCLASDAGADLVGQATHVIALSRDSSEVGWARSSQKRVVRPSWLLCCAHTWYKAREDGLTV